MSHSGCLEYQFHIVQVHKPLTCVPSVRWLYRMLFNCVACIDIKMMVIHLLRKERNLSLYTGWSSPLTRMPEWPSLSTARRLRNSPMEWQCMYVIKLLFYQHFLDKSIILYIQQNNQHPWFQSALLHSLYGESGGICNSLSWWKKPFLLLQWNSDHFCSRLKMNHSCEQLRGILSP